MKNSQRKKTNRSFLSFPLFHQLLILKRLRKKRDGLVRQSNESFFREHKTENSIERVQALLDANIHSLLSFFLRVCVVIIFIAAILLFLPLFSTPVRVNVRVNSIEFVTDDSLNFDSNRFNLKLETNQPSTFILDSTDFISSSFGWSGSRGLALRTTNTVSIENMHFPKNSTVKMEYNGEQGMNFLISSGTKGKDSLFTFQLVFREGLILGDSVLHVGTTDSAQPPQSAIGSKNLNTGKDYIIHLNSVRKVRWPAGVFVKSVNFFETAPSNVSPVSSVISGEVNLLETSDPAIPLYERDVLETIFKKPAELFISIDSGGINVHYEANMSVIKCGPQVMGKYINRMPRYIKVISEKAPYIWIIVTLIVTIITTVKIKSR